MSVPVFLRRITAPRQNSWPIVPMTIPHSAKHKPDGQNGMANAALATEPAARAATAGQRNEVARFVIVERRHASSGPTPVSSRRTSPTGVIHLLKNAPATVSRSPVTASLSVGNIVPKRMKSAANRRIQLFTMNAASRNELDSWLSREAETERQ